jgi:AraC-like DNA-binding protein
MRRGGSPSYFVDHTWVGVPLSGVFRIASRGEEHIVHCAIGVIFPRGLEYTLTHLDDDGDTDVLLRYAPEVIDEALPSRLEWLQVTSVDLQLGYVVELLRAAIARGADPLVIDETALRLLRRIASGATGTRSLATPSARTRVDRVRQLIAEHPEQRWSLDTLARMVGCSPFHLAHQFPAHTGTTVHQYLTDLRAAVALGRIEAGETSLGAVATELGFSHHSHLTATLRRRLGVTPRMIRAYLRGQN